MLHYYNIHIFKGKGYFSIKNYGQYATQCLLCGTKFSKTWKYDTDKFNFTDDDLKNMVSAYIFTKHGPDCPVMQEAMFNPDNADRSLRGESWIVHDILRGHKNQIFGYSGDVDDTLLKKLDSTYGK